MAMNWSIAAMSGALLAAGCITAAPTMYVPSKNEEPASIDYGMLQQAPSATAVGSVIDQMPANGAGEHHVELTYCTEAPGVVLPPDVRALYPTEITVVLQWQYWGLERVGDDIRVTVSFNQQPARIVIPLRAITTFRAPGEDISVQLRPGETSDQRCPDVTSNL
jgi:uncharacterized protein